MRHYQLLNLLLSCLVTTLPQQLVSCRSYSSSSLPEIACPLWAKEVLCKPIFAPQTQTLRYHHRILSPHCPWTCQACSSSSTTGNPEKEEDEEELDIGDVFVHCLDSQGPETEDVWKPGDPDLMYERIVTDFPQYKPTILSMPAKYHFDNNKHSGSGKNLKNSSGFNNATKIGPWIIQLERFLEPVEANTMIRSTRIEVMNGNAGGGYDPADETGGVCHSTQAWCYEDCLRQPPVQSVITKVQQLVGMPWKYAEPIHFIEYIPGEKYGKHHDYIQEEAETMQGPRLFTLLFYLNTLEDKGGDTCFPDVGVCIQPEPGRAVIWANVLNQQPWAIDNRTWHEANEITEGFKYASTVWYHLRNYEHAQQMKCVYESDVENYDDLDELDRYYDDDDYLEED